MGNSKIPDFEQNVSDENINNTIEIKAETCSIKSVLRFTSLWLTYSKTCVKWRST